MDGRTAEPLLGGLCGAESAGYLAFKTREHDDDGTLLSSRRLLARETRLLLQLAPVTTRDRLLRSAPDADPGARGETGAIGIVGLPIEPDADERARGLLVTTRCRLLRSPEGSEAGARTKSGGLPRGPVITRCRLRSAPAEGVAGGKGRGEDADAATHVTTRVRLLRSAPPPATAAPSLRVRACSGSWGGSAPTTRLAKRFVKQPKPHGGVAGAEAAAVEAERAEENEALSRAAAARSMDMAGACVGAACVGRGVPLRAAPGHLVAYDGAAQVPHSSSPLADTVHPGGCRPNDCVTARPLYALNVSGVEQVRRWPAAFVEAGNGC